MRVARSSSPRSSGRRLAGYEPAVQYPDDNTVADTLQQTAKLITADLGVRAIAVGTDGYDTHANQNDGSGNGELGYHDYLLYTVSEAVSAFYRDMAGHGLADRVVILIVLGVRSPPRGE